METCDGWIEGASCSQTGKTTGSGRIRTPESFKPRGTWGGLREGQSSMLHVTCDLCGKEVRAEDDQHYVVKIEAFAAHDPSEITQADLEDDHMEAVGQLLRDMEENLANPEIVEPCKHFRYDLCPECHRKFVRDPLGKESAQKFDFSEN
jgi:hypothetical protein